jgi:hypothetical protein
MTYYLILMATYLFYNYCTNGWKDQENGAEKNYKQGLIYYFKR